MGYTKILLPIVLLVFFAGCTSQKYAWNSYDDNLYAFYKKPDDRVKFQNHLLKTIVIGEQKGNIPPGIYAEYGYLQYENQNFNEAIVYFQKEHDRFPESRIFMGKMIDNAQKILEKMPKEIAS